MSSSSDHQDDDPSFVALAAHLKRRIDGAFDSVQAGPSPGGFVVEGAEDDLCSATHIPLSAIPRALHFLDLEPDDDLMGAFANAAAGWGAQDVRSDGVSRKDWRAICAALLGEDVAWNGEENAEDSGPDSDEYQEPSEEDSDDEYEELGQPDRAQIQSAPRKSATTRRLTDSEKAQCRRDFGRFFHDVPDSELDRQRIRISDIARVADVLNEKLSTEQMLEMLDAFSTSPDKSMGLADFERMMILTKLI